MTANSENLTDALEQLSRRIEAAEHRATLAITGIDQSVLGVISRLQTAEVAQSEQAGLYQGAIENIRTTQERLAEQIAKLEADEGGQRNLQSLKSLEASLAKLTHQVSESDASSDAKMAALQTGMASIADDVERAASELSRTVDEHANQTGLQLRRMRQELEGDLAGKIEQVGEAASARIEALDAKLETSLDAAQSGAAAVAETAVNEMAEQAKTLEKRLEDAEALIDRIGQGAADVAETTADQMAEQSATLDKRLTDAEALIDQIGQAVQSEAASAAEGVAKQMSARAEKLEHRLADAEAMIQQAASAAEERHTEQLGARREELKQIEGAVGKIRERLSAAEGVTDEALRALETSFVALDGRMRTAESGLSDLPARFERAKEEAEAARLEAAEALEASESAQANAAEAMRLAEERAETAAEDGARRLLDATRDVKEHLDNALSAAQADVQTALADAQAAQLEVERARLEAAEARTASAEVRQEAMEALKRAEASFADRFESMGRRLSAMVAESRVEIAQHLDTVSGDLDVDQLRQRIDEVASQVEQSEKRNTRTLAAIGGEIAKMVKVVDTRMSESDEKMARIARTPVIAPDGSEAVVEARLREIESQSASAVARVGEEMARVAERMEDKVRSAEERSDDAIQGVKRLMREVESGKIGGRMGAADSRQILEESVQRTRALVEEAMSEAMSTVHRRLDDAYEQTTSPNSPIQRALSDLSSRLEHIERHPSDISSREPDYSLDPPPYDAGGFDDAAPDALAAEEIDVYSATLTDGSRASDFPPPGLEASDYDAPDMEDLPPLPDDSSDEEYGFLNKLEAPEDPPIDDQDFGADDYATGADDGDIPPIAPLDEDLDRYDDLRADRVSDLDAGLDTFGPEDAPSSSSRRTSEPGFGPASPPSTRRKKPRRMAATMGVLSFLVVAAIGVTIVFEAGRRRADVQQEAARDPIMDRMAALEADDSPLLIEPEPMTPAATDDSIAGSPYVLAPEAEAEGIGADNLAAAGVAPPAGVDELDSVATDAVETPAAPADEVVEEGSPEQVVVADVADVAPALPDAALPVIDGPAPEYQPRLSPALTNPAAAEQALALSESEPAAIDAPSVDLAAPTLQQAADAGDPIAQFQLASTSLENGAVDAGAQLMRQAAENGLPVAQYQLAKLYEQGRGVPQDFGQARVWTERAANAGNIKAMHNLGIFFAEGRGADLDFQQAAKWFEEAALLGAQDSQHNLAVLYEQGLGVPLSLPDAYAWYRIAGREGDQQSSERADALAPRLTSDARASADQAVARFQPAAMNEQANGVFYGVGDAGGVLGPVSPPASATDEAAAGNSDLVIATARAQMLLTDLGYSVGPPDGMMGPRTADAIRSFQQSRGLAATGVVDEMLITQLEAATTR